MIRLIFKLLGFTLISGILIVGIYALGVNYNWYGELESAGTLVEDELPRSLVKEKYELQLKVNQYTPKSQSFSVKQKIMTPIDLKGSEIICCCQNSISEGFKFHPDQCLGLGIFFSFGYFCLNS